MEEKIVAVESNTNATGMHTANSQNVIGGQKEQTEGVKEQQIASYDTEMSEADNMPDVDGVDRIVRRLLELDNY